MCSWIESGKLKGVTVIMMFMRKREKGFTLIEVMLVVIIIGIIAIIALPKLLVTRNTAERNSCLSNIQALRTAVEQDKWETGSYAVAVTAPALVTELSGDGYIPANSTVSGFCPGDGVLTYDGAGTVSCEDAVPGDGSGHAPVPVVP